MLEVHGSTTVQYASVIVSHSSESQAARFSERSCCRLAWILLVATRTATILEAWSWQHRSCFQVWLSIGTYSRKFINMICSIMRHNLHRHYSSRYRSAPCRPSSTLWQVPNPKPLLRRTSYRFSSYPEPCAKFQFQHLQLSGMFFWRWRRDQLAVPWSVDFSLRVGCWRMRNLWVVYPWQVSWRCSWSVTNCELRGWRSRAFNGDTGLFIFPSVVSILLENPACCGDMLRTFFKVKVHQTMHCFSLIPATRPYTWWPETHRSNSFFGTGPLAPNVFAPYQPSSCKRKVPFW